MNRFDIRALTRGRELARPANLQRAKAARGDGKPPEWYRFANEVDENGQSTTVIYVYDMIDSWGGYWGISAQEFIQELMQVTTPTIQLRVNSPGGEVFEAVAMFAVLEAHPATITAYVDGLAASAASFLIMAAEKVVMHRNAQLMIHDAHGIAFGNAAAMEEMRGILDKISDNIAAIYAEKTGGTTEEWRTAMLGEAGADGTWYSAEEALAAGLVDEVTEKAGGDTGAGSGEDAAARSGTRVTNTTDPAPSEEDTDPDGDGDGTSEDGADPEPVEDAPAIPAPAPGASSTAFPKVFPQDVNLAELIRSAFASNNDK